MASYKDILKEKDNQNWLKGSLALRITKAGLRGLVEGESHRVQQNIHSSVLHARHLAAGTSCSLCLTEHVLPCPTRGLCSHPRNCKYHNTPFKIHRLCPSQICDDFRDGICAVHRYSGPSWKNTKANQWCTNHWQVAKCFMPPDGYHDVTSYDETDFNGIISVMINCTEFQRHMSFPIGNHSNALTEAREIGRKIRHSPDLNVTNKDLTDYFATLNRLLTDSTFLASDKDAQQAVLKLKQLKQDPLSISTEDEKELLEEARATIEAGKRQLAESAETGKKDLEGVVSQGKTAIEEKLLECQTVLVTGKSQLEDAVTAASVVTKKRKLEIENTVQVVKRKLEALQKIKAVSVLSEAEQREDLRQRLVKYYRKQLNSAPISPLLSDKDERLDKFYVPSKIEKKDHRRLGHDQQHTGSPISSYKQIFSKDKGLANTVFVVGEAGMGKSSFSAMCTIKWAAQFSVSMKDSVERGSDQDREEKTSFKRPLLNKKGLDQRGLANLFPRFYDHVIAKYNVQREYQELYHSLSDDDRSYVWSHREEFCELLSQPRDDLLQDEDTLRDIEFMFHIKLRDCGETCELSDMIRDQLINIIYSPEERAAGYDTMIGVLSNRKCVVIADGLDEWSHPTETKCPCPIEDQVIPHIWQTSDTTVLITSRPWRMSQNRIKDTKIGKYLEIKGVASTPLLVQKTLVCLNEKVAEEKSCYDFIQFVARRRLARLLSVPIIVLLLVCLWFEGVHESFSLCDIYACMMDMMFGRKSLPVLSVSPECTPLLQCFKQTKHVRNYYNIVLKLAQLAFEKLYSRDRKSSLVFRNVDCLTQEELLFVLKSGLMRETKSQSLTRQSSSFSFIHTTVQEFLAAVHIAHHTEQFQRVLKPNYYEAVQKYLASGNRLKDISMPDVSQVFIYMCGLNSDVAQDMSAMMSTAVMEQRDDENMYMYNDWVNAVQEALCSGYREAKANNVPNIQLHLMYIRINYASTDLSTLKTLISMNKSQLSRIYIQRHQEEISEEELQDVFISSKDTLTRVEMFSRAGQYDLSACSRLQYFEIQGSEISNITINTSSLVVLNLSIVSEKVERSILQTLEQNCEQLMKFKIGHFSNISLLCKTLLQLNHLKQLYIWNTTLGDHPLLLPPSVTDVTLDCVTMSARCLRELVENCSHTVKCCIYHCTVEPIKEYENIKRNTQSSKNITFELC
ncbi:uncharacterized protein LOC128234762 isoform X1 [Mya arenaria]|uniref:uncharacterized protein LOC128234762 isoform X1 n=1 Tax=Mya arenaria TaxID=6604 RepID=UPI0022E2763F|nr:uncharacterized protein LOC128234762 isoform X1 [Mya arenaria]